MSRTFATRRKSILEDSLDLSNIFNMYPFLRESEQVIHLYCICETNFNCSMLSLQLIKELLVYTTGLQENMQMKWKKLAPQIVSQSRLENSRATKHALDLMEDYKG